PDVRLDQSGELPERLRERGFRVVGRRTLESAFQLPLEELQRGERLLSGSSHRLVGVQAVHRVECGLSFGAAFLSRRRSRQRVQTELVERGERERAARTLQGPRKALRDRDG